MEAAYPSRKVVELHAQRRRGLVQVAIYGPSGFIRISFIAQPTNLRNPFSRSFSTHHRQFERGASVRFQRTPHAAHTGRTNG